jgi:two-component system, OmpR family, response regulator
VLLTHERIRTTLRSELSVVRKTSFKKWAAAIWCRRRALREGNMLATPRLLIVDGDGERRTGYTRGFRTSGFNVVEAESGQEAVGFANEWTPHAVVCAWPLRGSRSGLDLLRFLRHRDERMLIVVVGVLDGAAKMREVIEAGADFCLPADYDEDLLVTQVEASLERRTSTVSSSKLRCGDLSIDILGCQAWRGEGELALTPVEFRLLVALTKHCGEVVSKPRLLEEVWRRHDDARLEGGHLVDVSIASLRKKLNAIGSPILHTVRSQGFVLRPEL